MEAVEAKKIRVGYDLDGTLVRRQKPAEWASKIKYRISRPSFPQIDFDRITPLDHTPVDRPLGLKARISAFFHFRRQAFPGIPEWLSDEAESGALIYVVTGRKATTAWDKLTEDQLRREKIPFNSIFLTPRGVSGIVSKASCIKRLEVGRFYDDDKNTVLALSRIFKDRGLELFYLDHGIAPLGKEDLAANPNLHVIPRGDWCIKI